MNRDIQAEYWAEALGYAFDSANVYALFEQLSPEALKAISKDLAISAENQGQAFGWDAIPNPADEEIRRLKQKHKEELAREERRFDVLLTEAARVSRIEKHRISVSETELLVHRT